MNLAAYLWIYTEFKISQFLNEKYESYGTATQKIQYCKYKPIIKPFEAVKQKGSRKIKSWMQNYCQCCEIKQNTIIYQYRVTKQKLVYN